MPQGKLCQILSSHHVQSLIRTNPGGLAHPFIGNSRLGDCPIPSTRSGQALPALFAGGWGFRADYNLHECTSNPSAIKTSAACISSHLIAMAGVPHFSV